MKRVFYATATASALGALTAPQLLAQEAFQLDEITVSASLAPVQISRSGVTVEVLDAEALSNAGTSVAQTLARLPGVAASSNGGLGANATLRLRGLDSKYIGVRVDGIDVADPSSTQTQYNFGGLTAAGLGRLEVLKGSQSALYGSEAIGGVINMESWRPSADGASGQANVEVGSFDTRAASLSYGVRDARGEIALSFGRLQSEGISSNAGNTEKDGVDQTTVNLNGRYSLTDELTIGAAALYRASDLEIDRSANDATGENHSEQRGGRVFAQLSKAGLNHELSYVVFKTKRQDPGGFIKYFNGDRAQLSYLGSADLGANSTLAFGLDRTEEKFKTSTDEGKATVISAFSELRMTPATGTDLSLALRHDDHSEFGGNWTGRAAAVITPREDITVRAVLGTGFRAPSLFERFSPYGSTALSPETSRSAELGLEKRFGEIASIKATAFHTEIDDLIDFDGAATTCGSGFGCYNQVPGTTVTKGLEMSGRYVLNGWTALFGNYTHTNARTDGTRLARVPRHDLVLGMDAELTDRLSGLFEVQRVASVEPSEFAPPSNKVGNYTLVNLSLNYALTDRALAYLRIENLTDEDYETAGGFNTPGRAFYFGLRASF